MFKPYVDHLVPTESMESCNGLLWHLNDESNVTEGSAPVATDDRNVTIYFGKTYSVTSVHFVTSKQDDMPHEYKSQELLFHELFQIDCNQCQRFCHNRLESRVFATIPLLDHNLNNIPTNNIQIDNNVNSNQHESRSILSHETG
ncbi:unnamed protein product [Schistosoma margrebowiei]|uniref:Uncharacterized protein n=1 Tax=Schistosoma margrebowiei TaxID=48269 RepID=A0A3P7Z1T6_9TREM|nr:unnamed protein product [Schistosoma margrebowiei]